MKWFAGKTGTEFRWGGRPETVGERMRRLENVIDATGAGIWEWNPQTGEQQINERWAEIIGYTRQELEPVDIGTWERHCHPDDLARNKEKLDQLFARQVKRYELEFRMRHKDGHWVWILSIGNIIARERDGKPALISGIHLDISARKAMEEQLALSESRLANEKKLLEATLISVGDGVLSCDREGKVLFLNPAGEKLTGWTAAEAIGRPLEEVYLLEDEQGGKACTDSVLRVLGTGLPARIPGDCVLCSRHGDRRPVSQTASPIFSEGGEIAGIVVVFSDSTEERRKLHEIEYLSYHDYLTGLYNRRFFEEELRRLDTPRNLPLTLIMGDVNGLKLVNDSFGHEAGDALLRAAGEIMSGCCRADDIVARLGGDEFIILLPATGPAEAEMVLRRLHSSLKQKVVGLVELSIAFGFATKTEERTPVHEVFKMAEDQLYRNKLFVSDSVRSQTVGLIMSTLTEKNNREMIHSRRVSAIAGAIAKGLGLEKEEAERIATTGVMHDIGKIGIPERILNSKLKLSKEEWVEVMRHPEIGYRILSSVNEFTELAQGVLEHHERWDGLGYPKGLKGNEISLAARIIGLADAYEAMTGKRTYRDELTREEAMDVILRNSGTQFDPDLTTLFLDKVLPENLDL